MAKRDIKATVHEYNGPSTDLASMSNSIRAYCEARVRPNSAIDYLGISVSHAFNYLKKIQKRLDDYEPRFKVYDETIKDHKEFRGQIISIAQQREVTQWESQTVAEIDKAYTESAKVGSVSVKATVRNIIRAFRIFNTRMSVLEHRVSALELGAQFKQPYLDQLWAEFKQQIGESNERIETTTPNFLKDPVYDSETNWNVGTGVAVEIPEEKNLFHSAGTVRQLLDQLAGYSSGCWERLDRAGEFKSDEALQGTSAAHERLIEILNEYGNLAL